MEGREGGREGERRESERVYAFLFQLWRPKSRPDTHRRVAVRAEGHNIKLHFFKKINNMKTEIFIL